MMINISKGKRTFQLFFKTSLVFFILIVLSVESYAQSTLCESYPTSFNYEYLSDLTINGVSKTVASSFSSGADNLGYYDYTVANLTTLTAGQSYPVSFTVKTNGGYQEYVKVWFDFNGNGILSDDGEMVFDQNQTFTGTATYTGNITVPATAFNGDVYIRVMMVYSAVPTLCGTYDFGNTVDLKATITGGVAAHKLTVSPTGEGSVVSTPAGINTSSGQNSADFAEGTSVTLTAVPNAPQLFTGWSGDASGSANPLSVTMDEAKNITASFGLDCTNPSSGGTIASSQTICSGSSPSVITSSALPSGHTGTLEYKWQSSTTSSMAGFSDIASSNSVSYSPSSLNITTWYKRLSKVDCEPDWTEAVESNVVQIEVIMGAPSLSYLVSGTQNYSLNTAIPNLLITNSGGIVIDGNYSISPSLPLGLTLSGDGSISGTPTQAIEPTSYTITGTNVCGEATTKLSMAILITPTISNFSDITKMFFDASFEIDAPTSTSAGAFTYSSSNTAVAIISGTTVTILSEGSTEITATQAPYSFYAGGSITAILTVNSVNVVTKHGENTRSNAAYVNKNGAVGGNTSVNSNGKQESTKSEVP